jgi:hypothetical protein
MSEAERAAVACFVDVATRYCEILETHDRLAPADLAIALYPVLLELACRGATLPDFDNAPEMILQNDQSVKDRTAQLYSSLLAVLGEKAWYWEVFDPYHPAADGPIQHSLADDLADIYRDLRPGLLSWTKHPESTRRAIVWHWRFGYFSHWGHHIIDAIRAMHTWLM